MATSFDVGLRRQVQPRASVSERTSTVRQGNPTRVGAEGSKWVIPREGLQLALFFLVVISISRIHQHYGFLSAVRPGVSLLLLAAIFALINPRGLGFAGFLTNPAKLVAALVILACISVPLGISMGNSARFLL